MNWRRRKLALGIHTFLRQYGRKRPRPSEEPNDRQYDGKIRRLIDEVDPVELDELIREDEPPL